MRVWYLMLVLCIGCADSRKFYGCEITADGLIKGNENKLFVVDDSAGILRDKGRDSIRGGEYYLYKDGHLKAYKYFASRDAYTYNEEYDLHGKLIRVEGRPLVNTRVREVNLDSAFFVFYFFNLNKLYTNLTASVTDGLFFKLELAVDSVYSNMSFASFGISTKRYKQFDVYLVVDYFNTCTSKREKIFDTISLVKNPILNLLKAR